MQQYSTEPYCFSDGEINRIVVFRVDLGEISGKRTTAA
jgi:hypothetical protein